MLAFKNWFFIAKKGIRYLASSTVRNSKKGGQNFRYEKCFLKVFTSKI